MDVVAAEYEPPLYEADEAGQVNIDHLTLQWDSDNTEDALVETENGKTKELLRDIDLNLPTFHYISNKHLPVQYLYHMVCELLSTGKKTYVQYQGKEMLCVFFQSRIYKRCI